MTVVNVTRRFVKRDYFQSGSRGYFGAEPSSNSGGSAQRHWEPIRLTDLTSRNVSFVYVTPFKGTVIGLGLGSVYKFVQHPDNASEFIKQDVLHTFPLNLNPYTIFMLTIDASEDLTGVMVEFLLTE